MIINVLEYLENTVSKHPNKSAFICDKGIRTYDELFNIAQIIGSYILEFNHYNMPIFVFLDKDIRSIDIFMGVLYSGNYYVPIDVSQPDDRIIKLIGTSETPMIITDEIYKERIENLILENRVDIVLYEEMVDKHSVDHIRLKEIRDRHIDMDPAYMIFTSGSTGIPKGVVISHQSIIDYIEWIVDTFKFNEEEKIGNQSPFYFDNSVLDIYSTLKTGATMYIIPKICFSFYARLRDYLNDNKISMVFFVPSVLCNIARLKAFDLDGYPYLKKILFAGEQMPVCYLNEWRKHVPNALYANLYGPTEITVDCSVYIVDREFDDDEILPIGKASKNTEIIILNEENNETSVGQVGEICVRGRSLALGYYGDDDKSREVFVQNPLNNKYRDIIYRTGDVGKINERGEIICLGRRDFQIKHMGHRIELGEIEAASSSIKGIKSCACMYDGSYICLFYTGEIDHEGIKMELKRKLPDYMIPKRYIKLDGLPYNANGKINRKQLMNELKENENGYG